MPIKLSIQTTSSSGERLADVFTHTFACPHCAHEITESIARLKNDPVLVCAACGKSFAIESGGTVGDTVNQLDELDRAWNNLTKG